MGNHDTPASTECILCSLDRLGNGTDLVDLQEQRIASLELNGLLDEDRVSDRQIIAAVTLSDIFTLEIYNGLGLTQRSGSQMS